MCNLSYMPAGVPADEDGLFNAGLSNPDGFGWAITDYDRIVVGKSMDMLAALDDFMTTRAALPDGHAIFHSRWATHGLVNTDNVHPFPVGGSPLTVVAHNGVLPCVPAKGDKRSDTRLFADDILATRYRRLDKPRARKAMADYIGRGNKLAILTVDPRYRDNAYLINEEVGNWDATTGIWWSNFDYLGIPRWQQGYMGSHVIGARQQAARSTAPKYELPDGTCELCGIGTIGRSGFCDCASCGACEDCYEPRDDCQCWTRYAHGHPVSLICE